MEKSCKGCKHFAKRAEEVPCIICGNGGPFHKYEPQTNADRIRAMSDEELADALMRFVKGLVESEGRVVAFEEGFREELLHQLQQPVKDGDNT